MKSGCTADRGEATAAHLGPGPSVLSRRPITCKSVVNRDCGLVLGDHASADYSCPTGELPASNNALAGRGEVWSQALWSGYHKSVSTNGAKSQSQTSRVPNVWPCHWLSKRRSKTKKVTSQSWAPLDAHYGWASFVADRPSTNARQRISVDGRSPYHCLHATGHAFHWRRLAQNGTRGLPNGWRRIQTGLFGVARLQTGPFGVALPLKIQN